MSTLMTDIWQLLLDWAYHEGFVDEPQALFLTFAALTNLKPIMVEGTSGAGKSRCLNLIFKLIPPQWVEVARSDTAAHNIRMDWNGKYFWYIKELQNFTSQPGNVEILKTIMEGEDYTRRMMDGKSKVPFTVPKEIVPVMSIAYENRDYERTYNKDAEFHRRVPRVHLSINPTHIQIVKKGNARRRQFKSKYQTMPKDDIEELREIVKQLIESPKLNITNPFHEHLVDYFINYTTATTSHTERYGDFAEAFARMRLLSVPPSDLKRTHVTMVNGKVNEQAFALTMQDIALNHLIFGEECQRNILGIPYLGIEILEQFDNNELGTDFQGKLYDDDIGPQLNIRQVCKGLKSQGFVIDTNYVRKVMEKMEGDWHLSSDSVKDPMARKYSRVLDQPPKLEPDWVECWKAGKKNLLEDVGVEQVQTWVEYQQGDDGDIVWTNPLNGEVEILVPRGEVDG